MSIKRPTTTPCPDEIIDYWLPELSGAELKCLLYIVRHTFGYGKNITGDAISLDQFMHGITRREDGAVVDRGTGLASRTTISSALRGLEAKGLIRRTYRTSMAGDADVTMYVLDLEDEQSWPQTQALAPAVGGSTKSGPPPSQGSTKSGPPQPGGSTKSGLGVVQKSYPQQTTVQEVTETVVSRVPGSNNLVGDEPEARKAVATTDTRARDAGARAREEPTPIRQIEPRQTLKPGWVEDVVRQIHDFTGMALSNTERARWGEWARTTLRDYSDTERSRFVAYVCSTDYLKSLNSPRGVLRVVDEDYDKWNRTGMPTTKQTAPRRKETRVEWEHRHAYDADNGPRPIDATSDPDTIAAFIAELRTCEDGEAQVQDFLRSIGLDGFPA